MHSATYLSIDSLYNETQPHIFQETTDGLLHAFSEFPEYKKSWAGYEVQML